MCRLQENISILPSGSRWQVQLQGKQGLGSSRLERLRLSLTLRSQHQTKALETARSPSDTPITSAQTVLQPSPSHPPRLASSPEFPQRRLRMAEDNLSSWSGLLIPEITPTLAGPESSGIMPWLREMSKER